MLKTLIVTFTLLVLLIGSLAGVKILQFSAMMAAPMIQPPIAVATSKVETQQWESLLNSVGSLEALQGVVIAAEVSGRVAELAFTAGSFVQKGELLIQQDISTETAQLRAAEANMELSRLNLERIKELFAKRASSKADLDTAEAKYKESVAQADSLKTTLAKKSVKAPFAGKLGIRQVNLGQDLTAGTPVVTLQAIDQMLVNFSLPQRNLGQIKLGLPIRLTSDAAPEHIFLGQISAINSHVDPSTRTLNIQASLGNPQQALLPGMFGEIAVILPQQDAVVAVPQAAIQYASFGDSVFLVEEKQSESGEKSLIARQQFVQLGNAQGDFVQITKGLQEGQTIIVSGGFKVQNGSPIFVNNEVKPTFSNQPKPNDT